MAADVSRVPDQRLELPPVPSRVRPLPTAGPTGQAQRRSAGVHDIQDPVLPAAGQAQVTRADQTGPADVDQAVPEHVRAQQRLAVATLEPAQIETGTAEADHVPGECADLAPSLCCAGRVEDRCLLRRPRERARWPRRLPAWRPTGGPARSRRRSRGSAC